jgi:hypothetical protein
LTGFEAELRLASFSAFRKPALFFSFLVVPKAHNP